MSIAVASGSSRSAGPWACRRPRTTSEPPASAPRAQVEDERLLARIREMHAANYEAYGYRRMWKALLRAGEPVPRCRVQRLMRRPRDPGREAAREAVADDQARPEGRPAAAIWSSATSPRRRPNRLWVGDFTYLRCWEGVVYFAFVIDVFRRMIVGWQLAANMRTDLVLDALRMALGLRAPGADFQLVRHTDAGIAIHQLRLHPGARRPRGARVDRHGRRRLDNALAESFVDSYKTELIADRVWRTRAQLELATVEYVGWFNHERLHEALGDIPPVEFEQHHELAEPVDGPFSGNGSWVSHKRAVARRIACCAVWFGSAVRSLCCAMPRWLSAAAATRA